jgi:adenylate cyclase
MASNPFLRLFHELRRRRVLNVAGLYLVGAWLAIEVAATTFPYLGLPEWTVTAVIIAAAAGFPVAVTLAWAFQLEPDGAGRAGNGIDSARARRRYRGLAVAVVAVLATTAGMTIVRTLGRAPVDSVAVLPFADLSPGGDHEYFADGIAEELLEALARLDGLRVPGRTSSFSFKGKDLTVQEIGRQLGVAALLHGSVRRSEDRVRINVQLIDARTGFRVWSDSYDRQLADVFAVQNEIALAVVAALRVRLARDHGGHVVAGGTADPEAHALFLRGRHAWNRRLATSLRTAMEHFRAAVERDPGYAAAWAGLADVYAILPGYEGIPPAEWFRLAEQAARRALDLDSTHAAAYATLGFLYGNTGRPAQAERAFERAIALNPHYPTGRQWYGMFLSSRGRGAEAAVQLQRAHELDPLSAIIALNLGIELYHVRRIDDAIAILRQLTVSDPAFGVGHAHLARVLSFAGRHDEAAASARRGLEILGSEAHGRALVAAAFALARAGDHETARRIAAALEARANAGGHNPGLLGAAAVYGALGDSAHAAALYDEGLRRGDVYPTHSPDFDALRVNAP